MNLLKIVSRPGIWCAVGRLALILSAVGFFAGCTSVAYKPNAAAGPAKPPDYPIPVYTEEMRIPRPCAVIGTVSIGAGRFTMFGGSLETELARVVRLARGQGADAVRLTATEEPGFTNPNYRLQAELLRYSDIWETIPVSREVFRAYLKANQRSLDPIEGIWDCGGLNPLSIGIMKTGSRPGRDFVGFVLDSLNPVWPAGMKKIDIRRGPQPGSYTLVYYREDFERREIPIRLGQRRSFTLVINTGDESTDITYTKK